MCFSLCVCVYVCVCVCVCVHLHLCLCLSVSVFLFLSVCLSLPLPLSLSHTHTHLVDNYKGVSLLSIVRKSCTSILNTRLYNCLEENDKIVKLSSWVPQELFDYRSDF